jgi:hypothetical protein
MRVKRPANGPSAANHLHRFARLATIFALESRRSTRTVEIFFARRAAPLRIVRAHDRVAQSQPPRARRRCRAIVHASHKLLCRSDFLHCAKIAS